MKVVFLLTILLAFAGVVSADDCDQVGRFKVRFTEAEEGGAFTAVSKINSFRATLCSDGTAEGHGKISLFQGPGVISDFPLPPDMILTFKASTATWVTVGTSIQIATNVVPFGEFEAFLLENFGDEGVLGWSFVLRIPILDNASLDINGDGIVDVRVDVDLDE